MTLDRGFGTVSDVMVLPLTKTQQMPGIISTDTLPRFEYIDARTIEEAVFLLRKYGNKAAIIAGGADLLRELKNRSRAVQPKVLLNIKTITPGLDYIKETASSLSIGSLATLYAIETKLSMQGKYGILAHAVHASRALQYRNVATIGGDLCQQVKCWYNRASGNAYNCLRKGGEKCYAADGENQYHGIFGKGACHAVCASDTAPALVALGAKVKISSATGDRTIAVEDFFTKMGNVLKPGDVVTEVSIPKHERSRGAFKKIGRQNIFDLPLASVALVVRVEGGVCKEVKIALGGVSPIPLRASLAEQELEGKVLSDAAAERAAQAAVKGATPLSKNSYKVDLVKTLVKRAVLEVL